MTATRWKLSEALFFLEQLHANIGKEKKGEYYLSAFISSARAVTWSMVHEYCRVDGFAAWWSARGNRPEDKELRDGTNALRIRAEKRGGARTELRYHIPTDIFTPEHLAEIQAALGPGAHQLTVQLRPGELHLDLGHRQLVIPTPNGVGVDRRVDEFPDDHILPVCHRYLEWLAAIVDECEQRFPSVDAEGLKPDARRGAGGDL
jgi:hypothetical protein